MDDILQYKNFKEFFKKATGYEPYPYQTKLADSSFSPIINIPTGAGKTETAILGLWLWNRIHHEDKTPRRLIYCLPMRVLVEQTKTRIDVWLKNLGLDKRISVVLYMGGSSKKDISELEYHPEKEYILVGTQDMLVSGALNRAYGRNPRSWPRTFGLLNNDCMWIMDEVQIMENALPTSLQMNAFRGHFKTYGHHKTVWMSATINPEWMKTIDSLKDIPIYKLDAKDCSVELENRNNAVKTLHRVDIVLEKKYDDKTVEYLQTLHKPNTITAIMVNTVQRAQDLCRLFEKNNIKCKLIHSRFRAEDREELNKWVGSITENDDKIIISTQVLEAGVDISVRTMITEIAPWSNLVQRFGRCNRYGKMSQADIYWIDIKDEKSHPPYDKDDLEYARKLLSELDDTSVSPNNLPEIKEKKIFDAVIRKMDLIGFFDTSADLSGNHTDASRFVRTMKHKLNVNVLWRSDLSENSKPDRSEICSVPIYELQDLLKKRKDSRNQAYQWDYVADKWVKINLYEIFPGQTIMLDSKIGGYSRIYGWDVDSNDVVKNPESKYDSQSNDPKFSLKKPVTQSDHTHHVLQEMNNILKEIEFLDEDIKEALRTAVKYHDVGKIHEIFQDAMRRGIPKDMKKEGVMWAKSPEMDKYKIPEREENGGQSLEFRHEVASTLAYLQHRHGLDDKLGDLIAYLIMSHHGIVRLSLKGNKKREKEGYLLGYKIDGDKLPAFSGKYWTMSETKINMSLARIGRFESGHPSWTERAISVRDEYGPFCLAYLEALIRAADTRASRNEDDGVYSDE